MSTDNRPIGVLDSGLGGISVLRELVKLMPGEDFYLLWRFGECPIRNKNAGGGHRPDKKKDVEFLLSGARKAIVVACNTATSVAIKELRAAYEECSPGDWDRTGVKTCGQGKGTFQSRRHGNPDDAVTDEI